MKLDEQILHTLQRRGGSVATSRGYAGFVAMAQAMGMGMKGKVDTNALQKVTTECLKLEEDGKIVIDWSPNSKPNLLKCRGIHLKEDSAVAVATSAGSVAGNTPQVDVSLQRQLDALMAQRDQLLVGQADDRANIAKLEQSLARLREAKDAVQSQRDSLQSRVTRLIAEVEELQGRLQAAEEAPATCTHESELINLHVDRRHAEERNSELSDRLEELETKIRSLASELRLARRTQVCHDHLHRLLASIGEGHLVTAEDNTAAETELDNWLHQLTAPSS